MEAGTVVKLIGGGPSMTVVGPSEDIEGFVEVVWFSADHGELHEASLPVAALRDQPQQ